MRLANNVVNSKAANLAEQRRFSRVFGQERDLLVSFGLGRQLYA